MLRHPGFVARNGATLQEMRGLPLRSGVDLSTFTALTGLALCRLEGPPRPPLPASLRQLSLVGSQGCRRLTRDMLDPGPWELDSLVLARGFVGADLVGADRGDGADSMAISELRFALGAPGTDTLSRHTLRLGRGTGSEAAGGTAVGRSGEEGGGAAQGGAAVRRLVVDCASRDASWLQLGGGPWLAGVRELELTYADTAGKGVVMLVVPQGAGRGPAAAGGQQAGPHPAGGCSEAEHHGEAAVPSGHIPFGSGISSGSGTVDDGAIVGCLLTSLEAAAPQLEKLCLRFSTLDLLFCKLLMRWAGDDAASWRQVTLAPRLLAHVAAKEGEGEWRSGEWRMVQHGHRDGLIELQRGL